MPSQILVKVIRVPAAPATLAPGASITINPGLFSAGQPVVPTLIQPDRGTPIIVDTTQPITATSVTFKNTDPAAPAFAYFRFERGVSIEVDAPTLATSYWQGVTAASAGGFTAVNATAPIASSNPGGPVTTISLNPSGVTADTYGDNSVLLDESKMPIVTVTTEGVVSSASEESIRIGGSAAKAYVDNAASTAETNAKNYAEQLAFGISSKEPVHVTTTAVLPTYTGTAQVLTATANGPIPSATTDSHTLLFEERVLVKNEVGANEKYNGIYELTQVGDALNPWILTRTADANTDEELCGSLVSVQVGAVNEGTLWIFAANPATFTIGSDPVLFDPITFPNATTGAPGAVQLVDGLGGDFSAYNAPRLDADFINKGTLAVGRGGTGTTSLTARAALVANAAGTAVAGVSPGALGNVLTSDGTDWTSGPVTIPPVTVARNYYVTVDGNDTTGDGSLSAPYATIQKAHDEAVIAYPAGEQVVISVGPGNFATGTKITISRYNTFIIGQGARPEDQVTKIADPIEINCPAATQLYNEQVGIDGCFVAPASSFTDAAIGVTGAGLFSTVVTNCYVTTSNAAATASAVRSSATVGRVILWNCVATVQAASAAAYIIDLGDGTHKVGDTQIQHGSSVLNTATSAALALSGASYLLADRVSIDTRTNQYQVVINGTPYSGTTQMVLSNASLNTQPSVAPTSSGIDHSGSGALLLTDVFFTVPAARRCVNAGATSPVVYGQLSFATGFSTSIVATVIAYTNELHGEMYLNALTASLPLKLNASKKVISQAIDLGTAEVTGSLPNARLANSSVTITAGTGLSGGGAVSLGGSTTISLANTAVAPGGSFGSASAVGTFTVNSQGQLTAAGSTSIAIDASQVTTGTFALSTVSGPTGIGFGVTSATGVWAAATIGGTSQLVGFNASSVPSAITIGSGLSLSAGTLSVTGGGGTVTSVGMSGGTTGLTFTSDTANPITSSGTFTLSGTLAIANGGTGNGSTVTANTVFAGPSTGVPGAPSYRALVAADIPAIPASGITGIPYDLAAEVVGTPGAGDTIMRFVACRAFTMSTSGNASCAVAPSGTTDFDVRKNGSSIGTIQYTNAGVTGTVTITVATAFAAGDILTVVAPLALNGLDSPFFTFNAVL